jgi:hypothetical protein
VGLMSHRKYLVIIIRCQRIPMQSLFSYSQKSFNPKSYTNNDIDMIKNMWGRTRSVPVVQEKNRDEPVEESTSVRTPLRLLSNDNPLTR